MNVLQSDPANAHSLRLRLGAFGYCWETYGGHTGLPESQLILFGSQLKCSSARVGYNIDEIVDAVADTSTINDDTLGPLTSAMVLHPIAAALTALALVLCLFSARARTLRVLEAGSVGLAFVVCAIAFIVDVRVVPSACF